MSFLSQCTISSLSYHSIRVPGLTANLTRVPLTSALNLTIVFYFMCVLSLPVFHAGQHHEFIPVPFSALNPWHVLRVLTCVPSSAFYSTPSVLPLNELHLDQHPDLVPAPSYRPLSYIPVPLVNLRPFLRVLTQAVSLPGRAPPSWEQYVSGGQHAPPGSPLWGREL